MWQWVESRSVVSDSLWPRGLYSPWNSPGQNTGVGSLALLHGDLPNPVIKPRSPELQADSSPAEASVQASSVARSCTTLCDSMDCSRPSLTNSCSLLKLMSIELVVPSNHLILCCPLILPHSIFPSIRKDFKWVSSLNQVAKGLEFQLQHQCFQWIFRTDFL